MTQLKIENFRNIIHATLHHNTVWEITSCATLVDPEIGQILLCET